MLAKTSQSIDAKTISDPNHHS